MTPRDKQIERDREEFLKLPAFRRHLLAIFESAGITGTSREEQHALRSAGKRSLGLEILGWYGGNAGARGGIKLALEAETTLQGE